MFESLSDFHRKGSVSLSFVSNSPATRLDVPELRLNVQSMHQSQVRCVSCYHGTVRAMACPLADHMMTAVSRAADDLLHICELRTFELPHKRSSFILGWVYLCQATIPVGTLIFLILTD